MPTRARVRPGRLLASTILLLAGLLLLNLWIARSAASTQRHLFLQRLNHLPLDARVMFLGNSLVEAGCDTETFEAAWRHQTGVPSRAVNLALGATTPAEHALILKAAYKTGIHPQYVIYGFFDDQLHATSDGKWSNLIGNRAIAYQFPSDASRYYADGSMLKTTQLWLTGHIPMLAERSSLWTRVELLRRRFEEVGMRRHESNRYGRVEDFSALEASDVASFATRCRAAAANPDEFSSAVRDIMRMAQDHGATLIFLEMPLPTPHRQRFYSTAEWTALRARIQKSALQRNLVYVAASDWIPNDDCFEDATHLSQHGAKLFSRQLGRTVAAVATSGRHGGQRVATAAAQ